MRSWNHVCSGRAHCSTRVAWHIQTSWSNLLTLDPSEPQTSVEHGGWACVTSRAAGTVRYVAAKCTVSIASSSTSFSRFAVWSTHLSTDACEVRSMMVNKTVRSNLLCCLDDCGHQGVCSHTILRFPPNSQPEHMKYNKTCE